MGRVVVTPLLLPRPLTVVGGLAVVMFELPVRKFPTFSIMFVGSQFDLRQISFRALTS
jgi:hypothetical protein